MKKLSAVPPKLSGVFRALTISDLHWGHRNTFTHVALDNLRTNVINVQVLASVDVLFITGDVFDRLLTIPQGSEIYTFIVELLTLCKKCNTAIRILEGTPSHDWKQSKLFVTINESNNINADLLYVDTLSIVKDPTLPYVIGYVPDEIRATPEITTREFKEMMTTNGYQQLDFILMHGLMDFQIPGIDAPSFDSDEWMPLAKYMIYIGHDHTRKEKGNIVIPSSHDRNAHGEEGDKGAIVTDIIDGKCHNYFIPNVNAMPYITLACQEMDDAAVVALVEETVSKMSCGYLAIKLNANTNLKAQAKQWAKRTVPSIKVDYLSDAITQEVATEMFKQTHVTVNINNDTVSQLICDEVREKSSDLEMEMVRKSIEQIKSKIK